MRSTSYCLFVASALFSLTSCSSAKPAAKLEPDLSRIQHLAEVAPPSSDSIDDALQLPEDRLHQAADTGATFEFEGLHGSEQDPERESGSSRKPQRHHDREETSKRTIVLLRDPNWQTKTKKRERYYRFPHEGFYVGGSYGLTDGHESGGKLANDLNRRTPSGRSVNVALDDTDWGFKAFAGYRFRQPFALELAYVGLDGPDSSITAPVVDANLIGDIKDLHPVTGRGPSLSLLGFPYENGRLSTFAKVGVWRWESDVDVNLNGSIIKKSAHGWDMVGGLGVQYRLIQRLSARLEYERYFLDDNGIDMLSLGLTYQF